MSRTISSYIASNAKQSSTAQKKSTHALHLSLMKNATHHGMRDGKAAMGIQMDHNKAKEHEPPCGHVWPYERGKRVTCEKPKGHEGNHYESGGGTWTDKVQGGHYPMATPEATVTAEASFSAEASGPSGLPPVVLSSKLDAECTHIRKVGPCPYCEVERLTRELHTLTLLPASQEVQLIVAERDRLRAALTKARGYIESGAKLLALEVIDAEPCAHDYRALEGYYGCRTCGKPFHPEPTGLDPAQILDKGSAG